MSRENFLDEARRVRRPLPQPRRREHHQRQRGDRARGGCRRRPRRPERPRGPAARALLGPDKIIGVSAHNVEEAVAAQAAGADYLGVGRGLRHRAPKDDAQPDPARRLYQRHHGRGRHPRRRHRRHHARRTWPELAWLRPLTASPSCQSLFARSRMFSRRGSGLPCATTRRNAVIIRLTCLCLLSARYTGGTTLYRGNKTLCSQIGRSNHHENSINDRWKRFQRRRRYSGRHQDHDWQTAYLP